MPRTDQALCNITNVCVNGATFRFNAFLRATAVPAGTAESAY